MDFSSDPAFQDSTRTAVERVRTRAEDAIRVLDTLESPTGRAQLGPLAQRLSLDRVGVFGYSFGGAVAAETAWMDPRFKAAANLDGWQFAEAAEYGIKQPYLLMSDATPLPTAAELHSSNAVVRNQAILTDRDYRLMSDNMSRNGGIYAVLAGSTHDTIAAGNPRWRARLLIRLGLIDPPRTQWIVSTCLIEFFEQYLGLRADQPVSTWAARFAPLRLEIHPRPAALM
jgi:pimeloyl-ACP methyl ester carboxylesterase